MFGKIIDNLIRIVKKKEVLPIVQYKEEVKSFEGKVCLICGGTGGIGFAIAKLLIDSKCKIIIAGTNVNKLEEIKKDKRFPEIKTVVIDYSNANGMNEAINRAIDIYGHIDIFISSSGVHTHNVSFWDISPKEFDRVHGINMKGTYFACQAIAKHMKDSSIRGNILIVSSSRGSEPAWSPYGISKWGINGFIKGLASLLIPYGIVVNAIAPGTTATPLIGVKNGDSIWTDENRVKRYILPEEVASLAKYLVSEENKMIVGEVIHISGGRGTFDIR
ncbi:SDR family NAD(P)-dependent oxidoreductase [Blautia marasmi]|uniref:SDR family NAD(P)-dependent oxidoreductase n=1 Tax=Blautia marasmi TaxID=1917868 RepID=UPI000CF2F399|nr:SDR family oxidoreductase [Blautia marasmi]